MTELQKLKAKCYNKDGSVKVGATPADLARYKQLQDGEPLKQSELDEAKKREEERLEQDKADFKARQEAKVGGAASQEVPSRQENIGMRQVAGPAPVAEVGGTIGEVITQSSLDQAPEHPRIKELKDALRIFTQIEAHDSRPDDFVLFTRDVSITAGDVRRARKAMKV